MLRGTLLRREQRRYHCLVNTDVVLQQEGAFTLIPECGFGGKRIMMGEVGEEKERWHNSSYSPIFVEVSLRGVAPETGVS